MPIELQEWFDTMIKDEDFESILERFNIEPTEVFEILYRQGMIDEEIMLITTSEEE